MKIDRYTHGEPSWQDHSSPNDAQAVAFYSALLGWDCPEGDPEMGGYRNCRLNGLTVAGISPQMGPGPAVWSTYIHVDDTDAIAARVSAQGGQVLVPPMQVGDYGRMAVFVDPTGAVFGTWQPGTHKGAEVRNEPGAACWHELMTTDVAAAGRFYSAVFGWVARTDATGSAVPGGYTEFSVGDKAVAGMMAKPADVPAEVPSYWGVYFVVPDVTAAMKRITELGGQVLAGPMDIQWGRFAVATDPTGAMFHVFQGAGK